MSDEEIHYHRTVWQVRSDDGCTYNADPNTYESANKSALKLREGDEYGYSEPGAVAIERRECTWSAVLIHEPKATP